MKLDKEWYYWKYICKNRLKNIHILTNITIVFLQFYCNSKLVNERNRFNNVLIKNFQNYFKITQIHV